MGAVVKRRREMSLWPLAVVLIVGAVIVAIAIAGASRVRSSGGADHREDYLLDDLTRASRLVTPPGSHEVRLTRLPACPEQSAETSVERTLRFAGAFDRTAVSEQIISAYVRKGWTRNPFDPHEAANNGGRTVQVLHDPPPASMTIMVSSDGIPSC